MSKIVIQNSIAFNGNGVDILNPLVSNVFDEDLSSYEANNDVVSKIGFYTTQALTPSQKFRTLIGAYELDEIGEDENFPTMDIGFGAEKGFVMKQYANQIGITKLFMKWLETAKTLKWADTSVLEAWGRVKEAILTLRRGVAKRRNMEAVELLTKGFSITSSYGPGSATPNGKALFAADHPYGEGANAGTFSNVISGALTAITLQNALNAHKSALRLQNGDRVDTPSVYKLYVSRAGAVNARQILNTAGNQVGIYSGTGTNAMQLNQFSFQGNKIELVELPFLGTTKKDGTTVGTDVMWFLCNAEMAEAARAFRVIKLYDAEVGAYTNESNKKSYITLDFSEAVDHYGAESYIVGSTGV